MIQEQIDLNFQNDKKLALWKLSSSNCQADKNVFLTHGTFSDKKVCLGIGEYLVGKGYNCWVLEWRNHGSSSRTEGHCSFEMIGKEDMQRAFDYLFNEVNLEKIDCITHSGGGINLTINLLTYPENISRINRIVFFACQSFGAGYSLKNQVKLFLGKYLTKAIGFLPAKLLGRPHNEPYQFMKQWFDWNLSGEFQSDDGMNYGREMSKIKIPILSISGSGDYFVAPPKGCEMFLLKFENAENEFLNCGQETGFFEDYDHSRLIYSRNAEKEIYPLALRWIEKS